MKQRFHYLLHTFLLACLLYSLAPAQLSVVDSIQQLVNSAPENKQKVSFLLSLSRSLPLDDRDKAAKLAQSAAVLAERLGDTEGMALAHQQLGLHHRRGKSFDTALVHLRKAEKLFASIDNKLSRADVFLDIGRCTYSLGFTDHGIASMDTARSIYLQLIPSADRTVDSLAKRGVGETYHYSWIACLVVGRYERGLTFLERVEEALRRYGRPDRIPNLYNNFGITYRVLGEYDKAMEFFLKGLTLAEEQNAWEDQNRLHANIATIHTLRSEDARAREHLLSARDIAMIHQKHDPRLLAHPLSSLGELESRLGRYDKALEYYLAALTIFEKHSTPLALADFLVQLSEFYVLQDDYETARLHLNRALGLYRQIRNNPGVSHVFFLLGKVALAQKDYEQALDYHLQGLEIRRQGTEKLFVALSMRETGNVLLLKAGNEPLHAVAHSLADSAASLFRQGIDISREISDENTLAGCLSGLGRVEMLKNNWQAAAEQLTQAARIADTLGLKRELFETYRLLAEVHAKLQRPEDAFRYHQLYAAVKDSVFNETSSKQLKEMQARYDSEKKDLEIASLNQQKEIAGLKVKEQESALRQAELQTLRKESDIKLLNQTQELQQQQLLNANRTLYERDLEAKARLAELEAARKEQLLQEHTLEEQRLIMYGSIALVLLTGLLGLVLFNRFQLRKELDKRTAILEERRRISSDMHDDLGSSLSTIALLSQVMKQHSAESRDRTEAEKISVAAQDSLEKMSEIVWSLNPRNDKLENLVAYIRKYAMEYLENSPVNCTVTMAGSIPESEITGEQRRNVFLTAKEALHNIIKHSGATCARLSFEFRDHTMQLSINDNGKGIDTLHQNAFGNGMVNMRRRMKEAGGEVSFENEKGTTVRLTLPVA